MCQFTRRRYLRWSLARADGYIALFIGIGLWGLHMGMTQGILASLIADVAPAQYRGTAFGVFNLVSGTGLLIASGLAGWLWDRYSPSATFAVGAAGTNRRPRATAEE